MSVDQIEANIRALPPAERARLVEWLDDHRDELLGGSEAISKGVRAELELRLKELDEHPEWLESFEEEDLKRMFSEFENARSQKPSAGKN
jgi:hypothetical protein